MNTNSSIEKAIEKYEAIGKGMKLKKQIDLSIDIIKKMK